ncbi:MAG: NUDIX domain-containing protein [Bacteroidales bacterium]|nr:NUDIX domain-containing protein [Bacteroidales bacterium]
MYNIYFNKRVLNICDSAECRTNNPNSIYINAAENAQLATLPLFFEQSSKMNNLVVCANSSDIETTFKTICSQFVEVNAAGGLVENSRGEYLLIYRNGFWDLPKGKQEEGEDIALTALREVEEECGISGLEQKELLCITRHTYRMNGEFVLKHTYWYKMKHSGECNLVPQLEEGINEVRWVAKEDLGEYLNNTYPSIKEVFASI